MLPFVHDRAKADVEEIAARIAVDQLLAALRFCNAAETPATAQLTAIHLLPVPPGMRKPRRQGKLLPMKLQRFHSFVCVLILQIEGCIPATTTIAPQVSGRVLDISGKPVDGAEIRVAIVDSHAGAASWKAASNARGQFHRDEQTRWCMAPLLPADFIAPEYVAVATRNDLHSAPKRFGRGIWNFHFLGLTNKTESFDLGDLVLNQK